MSANGFLTDAELAPIGNGLFLRNDAAAAWALSRADAAKDGINIQTAAIASAYRPWAMQLDMRKNPQKYGINPNLGGLPGLPSRHGLGNCRDVPFGAPNNWMIEHGAERGWHRPAATMAINDLNHWEFTPGTATAGGGTPIDEATARKANGMTTVFYTDTPKPQRPEFPGIPAGARLFALAGDGSGSAAWLETTGQDFANSLTGAHHISGLAVALSPDTFISWRSAYRSAVPVSGGTEGSSAPVDLSPVLTAIAGVPKAVNDDAAARLAN